MAGSAHGVDKGGLTDKGRDMVKRMEAKKMIVDLSHGSDQQIDDVLAMATRPVVVSHTGVRGTCDNRRNLSDVQLRAIAANGGLVGIGFWETAVCGKDAAAIAKAVRYAAELIGIDHVALGSDFDGAVPVPFDASGMVKLTEALLAAGFSPDDTAKVMGGNEIRFCWRICRTDESERSDWRAGYAHSLSLFAIQSCCAPPEMLRQLQALRLVVGAEVGAVERLRPRAACARRPGGRRSGRARG